MENIILKHIVESNDYFGKVYPHLKSSHFKTLENSELFKIIQGYVIKYDTKPSFKEMSLIIKQSNEIQDSLKPSVISQFKKIVQDSPLDNYDFLLGETEKYIQKIELVDAIYESANIIENDKPFEGVLGCVEKALAVTFDYDTGMEYNTNADSRYEYYHNNEETVKTGTNTIDKELNGGFSKKSLNVIVAPSHGGKSAYGVSVTAAMMLQKKNVLFLTLEMPEYEIGKRIDSNLINHPANELWKLSKEEYISKIKKIEPSCGKLIIKEYPAGEMSVLKMKALMNELESEDGFKPDAVVIDYLTLMASSRVTLAQSGGNYQYYKAIAEELHGFCKKEDMPVVTFGQLNRCIETGEKVTTFDGKDVNIGDLKVGDEITGTNNQKRKVKYVSDVHKQEGFIIKTKSGKSIKVSKQHRFPTPEGLKSILYNLKPGDKICSKGIK